MSWEKFKDVSSKGGQFIRINPEQGVVSVSKSLAGKRFDDGDYVDFYIDVEGRRIAIDVREDCGKHSYTITKPENNMTKIECKSLFSHLEDKFGIENKRYYPEWDEEEELLVIDLKEAES